MCTSVFATCWLLLVPLVAMEPKMDVQEFFKELNAQRREAARRLQDDSIWSDSSRKAELLRSLEMARALRSATLVATLAKRIAYSPFVGVEDDRIRSLDERYPVYSALREIGVHAVKPLIARLTEIDAEDRMDGGQTEYNLTVHCLIKIYDEGGCGASMARERVEREWKLSTGIRKANLLKALEDPRLKQ